MYVVVRIGFSQVSISRVFNVVKNFYHLGTCFL